MFLYCTYRTRQLATWSLRALNRLYCYQVVLLPGCTVTRSRQSGSLRRDHQCLISGWAKDESKTFPPGSRCQLWIFHLWSCRCLACCCTSFYKVCSISSVYVCHFVCNIPTNNYCLFLHSYPQHSHLQDSLPQSFLEPNSGATIMDWVISQLWGFCRHNISYAIIAIYA